MYLSYSSTHFDHEASLVDSGASFCMTSHREWFCEYEIFDGRDVLLGYELKTIIIV